jgi:hypothetical protein
MLSRLLVARRACLLKLAEGWEVLQAISLAGSGNWQDLVPVENFSDLGQWQ